MPFKQIAADQQFTNLLQSNSSLFLAQTTFGSRIRNNDLAKRKVAAVIVQELIGSAGAAFATDGSSTFYVGLGVAETCLQSGKPFTLRTNNLAISSHLDSCAAYPQTLRLEILRGEKNYDLNATFPSTLGRRTQEFIQEVPIVIASVSELFVREGPTSPDFPSRLLKRVALQTEAALVIALEWDKMSSVQPRLGSLVFSRPQEWQSILETREVWVVCDKPDFIASSYDVGLQLEAQQMLSRYPERTSQLQGFELFCWRAYNLSEQKNITFVEVN
jgi:hypothetical protein